MVAKATTERICRSLPFVLDLVFAMASVTHVIRPGLFLRTSFNFLGPILKLSLMVWVEASTSLWASDGETLPEAVTGPSKITEQEKVRECTWAVTCGTIFTLRTSASTILACSSTKSKRTSAVPRKVLVAICVGSLLGTNTRATYSSAVTASRMQMDAVPSNRWGSPTTPISCRSCLNRSTTMAPTLRTASADLRPALNFQESSTSSQQLRDPKTAGQTLVPKRAAESGIECRESLHLWWWWSSILFVHLSLCTGYEWIPPWTDETRSHSSQSICSQHHGHDGIAAPPIAWLF